MVNQIAKFGGGATFGEQSTIKRRLSKKKCLEKNRALVGRDGEQDRRGRILQEMSLLCIY